MKIFEKFLFFYSIIAITVIMICFGIFEPRPLNLISTTLLTPILFYFWIKLTSPEKTSPEIWSIRFLLAIAIISSLGIGAYYLKINQIFFTEKLNPETKTLNLPPSPPPKPTLEAVVQEPKADESITDILYGTTIPIPTTFLKTNTNSTAKVYKDTNLSSEVIYTLIPDQLYPYSQKVNAWYKVYISDSLEGWVESSRVTQAQ